MSRVDGRDVNWVTWAIPDDRLQRWRVVDANSPGVGKEVIADKVRTEEKARLIAAAPDLLEALRAMLDMYGPRGGNFVFDGPAALARDAIARATGRRS